MYTRRILSFQFLSDSEELAPAGVDFAARTGSAVSFLERAGIVNAFRGPSPGMTPAALRVHSVPLEAPLPDPALLGAEAGSPPPDRGETGPWPHEGQPEEQS